MATVLQRILLLILISVSCASNASQMYAFSYTFGPGEVVSGSFNGDAAGDLITNLSNIAVSKNGVALNGSGSLLDSHIGPSFNWVAGGGIASFSGLHNNFGFSDTGSFDWVNFPNINFYISNTMIGLNGVRAAGVYTADTLSERLWLVTAVPEPSQFALLLMGAIAVFFLSHRRGRDTL